MQVLLCLWKTQFAFTKKRDWQTTELRTKRINRQGNENRSRSNDVGLDSWKISKLRRHVNHHNRQTLFQVHKFYVIILFLTGKIHLLACPDGLHWHLSQKINLSSVSFRFRSIVERLRGTVEHFDVDVVV